MCNRVAHILVLWASVEKKKDMKLYLSKAHSDEDGPLAKEGEIRNYLFVKRGHC